MSSLALPAPLQRQSQPLARDRRESASFGDVVHARWHAWHSSDDDAKLNYEATRAVFEAEHGKILDDYWATREPAAVALCCRRTRFGGQEWSLHCITGSLAAGRPEYSRLLLHGARESVHASTMLRGMAQCVAISNLYSLTKDLMASLEVKGDDPEGRKSLALDLQEIASYIGEAGQRRAQIVYLRGVTRGLLALIVLAPLLALLLADAAVPGLDSAFFVGSLIAGAFGAAMSVLNRMSSGRFEIGREVGRAHVTNREYVSNLGVARPFIGATFAALLYFACQGKLVAQFHTPASRSGEFAFFIASGFLIGFSERFAKEIVRTADSGSVGGIGSATEQPVAK
jgi:hypothetical protein